METVARVTRLRPVAPTKTDTDEAPATSTARLDIYQAIASVIAASAAVLATRLILLLTLIGGFVLAIIAAESSSWMAFATLCAYAVLVLIPMVLLEIKTKWSGG